MVMATMHPQMKSLSRFLSLHKDMIARGIGDGIQSLFQFLRVRYLSEFLTPAEQLICERAQIPTLQTSLLDPAVAGIDRLTSRQELNWGDWRFHLSHRLHLRKEFDENTFASLMEFLSVPLIVQSKLKQCILSGIEVASENGLSERRYYDFSILPLNLLLGERVLKYFMPPMDYFAQRSTSKEDPYGLLWATSRATEAKGLPVAVIAPEDNKLLGSHKFSHTLLMNIDFYCPIGCSDCYKTRFGTREYTVSKSQQNALPGIYNHPEYGRVQPPSAGEVVNHARRVVDWLNNDSRGQAVYDVIISGGEPFILSDEKIAAMLAEMAQARNLRILRICTGTLFLGLPMRITENLADILESFMRQTGVRVTIQAHLACHEQIAPEAVMAISRLRKRGISIYSQIPIKEGINFFADDLPRSVEELALLCKKQVAVGVEPYMLIVDMHPSTNAFYVPIEPLLAVWGALVESHDFPGLERPRTLSILFEKGNVILSGNTLLAMRKSVDQDRGVVTYQIPRMGIDHAGAPDVAEMFEYQEPVSPYNADPESLQRLSHRWEVLRATWSV